MRYWFWLCALVVLHANAEASSVYIGHSGAPGRLSCALSCHGPGGGAVVVTGFPERYAPGQVYTISIHRTSGQTINNFNASCRVGTGTVNAGVLAGGLLTAAYSTTNETNGIHFSSANHDSGTFLWTAPEAGTDTVRLYMAAHQRPGSGGPNTNLVLVAAEETAPEAPEPATGPVPGDSSTGVLPNATLHWIAGAGATAHHVFFGLSNPPDSVGSQPDTFLIPFQPLLPGTTYYWQVNENNEAGTTVGPVWQFTTLALPDSARNPQPADGATQVSRQPLLEWSAAAGADSYNVYLGLTEPLEFAGRVGEPVFAVPWPLDADTVYRWRVDALNSAGITAGAEWSFRTESASGSGVTPVVLPESFSLGPVYPNPFNAAVSIPFVLPEAMTVELALFDVTGRRVAVIARGLMGPGAHHIDWNADGVGSGVYLLRLASDDYTRVTKVMAIR